MSLFRIISLAIVFSLLTNEWNCQNNADTSFLRSKISPIKDYSFIRNDLNYIEFENPTAISFFFQKLDNVKENKVRILHIGDSHLQADIGANFTRCEMQKIFGFGGRGYISPYSAAKTHSTHDYNTQHSGIWDYSKNLAEKPRFPLGISGVTIRTADSTASFLFNFNQTKALFQPNFKKLDIYTSTGDSCFQIEYQVNEKNWKTLEKDAQSKIHFSAIMEEAPYEQLKFRMVKRDSSQKSLQIYGIHIESTEKRGKRLYQSVGINGARINAIPKLTWLPEQFKDFPPDLIILDLVANDVYKGAFDTLSLKKDLDNALRIFRNNAPQASILLVGMQDIYFKGSNVINAQLYSEFLRNYANKNNISFYDYFRVAGGKYSMKKWRKSALSTSDMCHLTKDGYELKGQLFNNAILSSYLHFKKNPKACILLIDTLKTTPIIQDEVIENSQDKKASSEVKVKKKTETKKGKIHTVKKGDTLIGIATKNRTTVEKIKRANHLKSEKIIIGQKLKIP